MKERCAAAARGAGAPADARPGSFLVVTDTAQAQICGVLRKFRELQRNLREMGCEVLTLAPDHPDALALRTESALALRAALGELDEE